jgi:hypothetical protein
MNHNQQEPCRNAGLLISHRAKEQKEKEGSREKHFLFKDGLSNKERCKFNNLPQ